MKILKAILILILLFGISNCSKRTYECGLNAKKAPPIESKILKFDLVAIADTTTALIRGNIAGKHVHINDTIIQNLEYSTFSAIDKNSGKIVGSSSNLQGNFKLAFPASLYRFEIQFIGYNTLVIDNVKIGTGEIYEFDSLLGQGDNKSLYIQQKDKSIVRSN